MKNGVTMAIDVAAATAIARIKVAERFARNCRGWVAMTIAAKPILSPAKISVATRTESAWDGQHHAQNDPSAYVWRVGKAMEEQQR